MAGTEDRARRGRTEALPPSGGPLDHDRLLDPVDRARFVLLGEALHGSHELYWDRARSNRRLLEERCSHAVIVEAPRPDAVRVNRFVHGTSDAVDVLGGFERFPAWRCRNVDDEAVEPPGDVPLVGLEEVCGGYENDCGKGDGKAGAGDCGRDRAGGQPLDS